MHVEPEAQATPTDAGRKQTAGRHRGDVPLPLNSRVCVKEFAFAPLETSNKVEGIKYSDLIQSGTEIKRIEKISTDFHFFNVLSGSSMFCVQTQTG